MGDFITYTLGPGASRTSLGTILKYIQTAIVLGIHVNATVGGTVHQYHTTWPENYWERIPWTNETEEGSTSNGRRYKWSKTIPVRPQTLRIDHDRYIAINS
jgi:hypothetical protein